MILFHKKIIIGSCLMGISCASIFSQETGTPKANEKKDAKQQETSVAQDEVADFQNATPYNRNSFKNLPSPFINQIIVEKIKIKKELEIRKKEEEEAKIRASLSPEQANKTELPDDQKSKELIIIQEVRKGFDIVQQLVDLRKYEEAEAKLTVLDTLLFKNNIEKMRDEVTKKREIVVAEHKDWDDINKVLESLVVDAMFIAEGKKKIALINDIAVEENDDLNDILGLNKGCPIILTYVSTNSLKIKFKKFTLQKELIDNDL